VHAELYYSAVEHQKENNFVVNDLVSMVLGGHALFGFALAQDCVHHILATLDQVNMT